MAPLIYNDYEHLNSSRWSDIALGLTIMNIIMRSCGKVSYCSRTSCSAALFSSDEDLNNVLKHLSYNLLFIWSPPPIIQRTKCILDLIKIVTWVILAISAIVCQVELATQENWVTFERKQLRIRGCTIWKAPTKVVKNTCFKTRRIKCFSKAQCKSIWEREKKTSSQGSRKPDRIGAAIITTAIIITTPT